MHPAGPSEDQVRGALRHVVEHGHSVNIVDRGLLAGVRVDGHRVLIELAAGESTAEQVRQVVADIHSTLAGFLGLRHVRVDVINPSGRHPV